MRIFSKTIKVIGVSKSELNALRDLVHEASVDGKAERQMSPTEYIAVEVNDVYERVRSGKEGK